MSGIAHGSIHAPSELIPCVNAFQRPSPVFTGAMSQQASPGKSLDIDQIRADTPGCSQVIHLNNAGSALPPSIVVKSMIDHLRLEEQIGGYEALQRENARFEQIYRSIATFLNTQPGNIALTQSATEGWDRAFSAIAFTHTFTSDARMLVSSSEYASNVLPMMQIAAHTGASLEFIPDNAEGTTDLDALESMLDSRVRIVAINHCPSQNGLINDVTGIGALLKHKGSQAWYLVDACQSVGQLPVDAPAIGADFISATGRKFLRGPRGTGFLYCSDRAMTELEPFPIDLHSGRWTPTGYELREGAARFESWEKPYAALLGLGAAVDYALDLGIKAITERIEGLASYTRQQIKSVPGASLLDRGKNLSGIVTFTGAKVAPRDIVARLRESGVHVSLGTAEYSQVDYLAHGIESLIRVSPHVFNTKEEIDSMVSTVQALVR